MLTAISQITGPIPKVPLKNTETVRKWTSSLLQVSGAEGRNPMPAAGHSGLGDGALLIDGTVGLKDVEDTAIRT